MPRVLRLLPDHLAITRIDGPDVPAWAWSGGGFASVTRRGDEMSVVCDEGRVPAGARSDGGWRALELTGTQELALTGVLISLAAPLADAGVPLFALATYDTDVILVPGARLTDAVRALEGAGHGVAQSP